MPGETNPLVKRMILTDRHMTPCAIRVYADGSWEYAYCERGVLTPNNMEQLPLTWSHGDDEEASFPGWDSVEVFDV